MNGRDVFAVTVNAAHFMYAGVKSVFVSGIVVNMKFKDFIQLTAAQP